MAYTGFIKTEDNPGAKTNGWLWLETYINKNPLRTARKLATGSIHYHRSWAGGMGSPYTKLYCHQNAAPEPVTDGHILTSVFDDATTEFSAGAGYIHSFTSSSGIFTADQTLDIQPQWNIHYNAKNTGVAKGYVGNILFKFYKRDAANRDTLLFTSQFQGVGNIYSGIGLTLIATPQGTVLTTDRLRIRVYMWQSLPA